MKKSKTNRGFDLIEFKDRYSVPCSIQKSSLAFEHCIWIGVDDPIPRIMKRDAEKMGLHVEGEVSGWQPYDVPPEVLMSTRMHLTQKHAKKLIPILQKFVDTGEI